MKTGVRVWIIVACCVVLVIGIWIAMSKRQSEVPVTSATPAPSRSQDLPPRAPQPVLNPPPSSSTVAAMHQTPGSAGQTPSPQAAPASALTPPTEPPRSNPPAAPTSFVPPPVPEDTAGALIDLNKVSLMVRDYRTLMGENPIGTNAEIMKSILGANPKGAKLGPPEGQSLNSNGELIDRWGTPYFFHQLSATRMEIWSAGPDRKIGTSDDIIQK